MRGVILAGGMLAAVVTAGIAVVVPRPGQELSPGDPDLGRPQRRGDGKHGLGRHLVLVPRERGRK